MPPLGALPLLAPSPPPSPPTGVVIDGEDSEDDDDHQISMTNCIQFEDGQHSACNACALGCSDFKELCVSNFPLAPPAEITEFMFSDLLPACQTQLQRNHITSAISLSLAKSAEMPKFKNGKMLLWCVVLALAFVTTCVCAACVHQPRTGVYRE